MDAFLAICQGLGLALAAGLVFGVVLPAIMPTWGVIVGAAPLGMLAAGAALSGAGEPLWPALPVGVLGAGLAATVSRGVAAGAMRRERETLSADEVQTPSGVTTIVVLVALIVAAVSLFVEPISLLLAAALSWLALSRRRQETRKHEGLRVLR